MDFRTLNAHYFLPSLALLFYPNKETRVYIIIRLRTQNNLFRTVTQVTRVRSGTVITQFRPPLDTARSGQVIPITRPELN